MEKYFLKNILKKIVIYKEEIDFGYSLALRFPLEKGVLGGYFELLKNSSEYRNWRSYLKNKPY